MSPNTADDDITIDWLGQLREDSDDPPGGELVHVPAWTQTEWDRRQVRQLRAVEATIDHLAASDGKPESVAIRDALLMLGCDRAASGEHGIMAATSAVEDQHSIYAAMFDRKRPAPRKRPARKRAPKTVVVEPTAVHTPGRRRKPDGA